MVSISKLNHFSNQHTGNTVFGKAAYLCNTKKSAAQQDIFAFLKFPW